MNVSDKPLQLTLDVSKAGEMLQESFSFTNESTKDVLTFNQLKCPVPLDPGESYGLEVSCHTCKELACTINSLAGFGARLAFVHISVCRHKNTLFNE